MVRLKAGLWAVAFLVFALFPTVVKNPAFMTIAVYTLVYMACATSWNMFSGYSGYVALGSAAFFGTGAYTMALFSVHLHMAGGAAMFWLVPWAVWSPWWRPCSSVSWRFVFAGTPSS